MALTPEQEQREHELRVEQMETNIEKMRRDMQLEDRKFTLESRKFTFQIVLGLVASITAGVGAGVALTNWVNGRVAPAIQAPATPAAPR